MPNYVVFASSTEGVYFAMENIKLWMCISFLPFHLCMTCSRSFMHTCYFIDIGWNN